MYVKQKTNNDNEENLIADFINSKIETLEKYNYNTTINILTYLFSATWFYFFILDSYSDIIDIVGCVIGSLLIFYFINLFLVYYFRNNIWVLYLLVFLGTVCFLLYSFPIGLHVTSNNYVNLFGKELISEYDLLYGNEEVLEAEFKIPIDIISIKAKTDFSNKGDAVIYYTDGTELIKCNINTKGNITHCWK